MVKQYISRRSLLGAIIGAGVAAGVVSTLVQVLLWVIFTDEFPAVLFRDARLTAALALGGRVLPPPATFDAGVWIAAMFIHFALSICYAALLAPLATRIGSAMALVAGAVFGAAIYVVNLYGFTEVFPWFTQARGWITVAAHVIFGLTAASSCRFLCFRNG